MTKKIAISIPDEIYDKADRAVQSGDAESISGYFAELARREPDWAAAREVLADMAAEHGELTDADRAYAAALFADTDPASGAA